MCADQLSPNSLAETLKKIGQVLSSKCESENSIELTGDFGKCAKDVCDLAKTAEMLFNKRKFENDLLNAMKLYEIIEKCGRMLQFTFIYITETMDVELEEHNLKIEAIKQGLKEVEDKCKQINEQINKLSKSLLDMLRVGDDSKRANYLKAFDLECDLTMNSLIGCFDRMDVIKRQINDGLASTDVFKKRLARSATLCLGIGGTVAGIGATVAIIAKLVGAWVLGASGIGVLIALVLGVGSYYFAFDTTDEQKAAQKQLNESYHALTYTWDNVNADINLMRNNLHRILKSRKSVC